MYTQQVAQIFVVVLITFIIHVTRFSANMICESPLECKPCQQGDQISLSIDCSYLRLYAVPHFLPLNATNVELKLNDNQISSLADKCFRAIDDSFIGWSKIDLNTNQITEISTKAFDGLSSTLTTLILRVNLMQTFPIEAFAGLVNLTTLQLDNFYLQQLPPNALSSLNKLQSLKLQSCGLNTLLPDDLLSQVSSLTLLDLDGNQLTEVPTTALSQLSQLSNLVLSFNRITRLTRNAFVGLNNLRVLDLSYNRLRNIDKGALDELKSLNTLIMISCQLTSMDEMKALIHLQSLILLKNFIVSIPKNIFSSMSRLAELNLNFNRLTHLEANAFAGAELSLRELYLNGNEITHIDGLTFRGLTTLQILDVSNQNLSTTLSSEIFDDLKYSLKTLSMINANLLPDNLLSLRGLQSLEEVTLSWNNIEYIPVGAFLGLSNVAKIDLGHNKISSLTRYQLEGTEGSLSNLILDSNRIKTLDQCTFSMFNQLSTLSIRDNPLTCDCYLLTLLEPFFNEAIHFDCYEPRTVKLIDWFMEGVVCDNEVNTSVDCGKYFLLSSQRLTDDVPSAQMIKSDGPIASSDVTLTLKSVSDTAITVRWNVSKNLYVANVSCCFHSVHHHQVSHRNETLIPVKNHSNNSGYCVYENLQANKDYKLCVFVLFQASNDSVSSNCLHVTTLHNLRHVQLGLVNNELYWLAITTGVIILATFIFTVMYCMCKRHISKLLSIHSKGKTRRINFNSVPLVT